MPPCPSPGATLSDGVSSASRVLLEKVAIKQRVVQGLWAAIEGIVTTVFESALRAPRVVSTRHPFLAGFPSSDRYVTTSNPIKSAPLECQAKGPDFTPAGFDGHPRPAGAPV